jgi:hypothetical protein
MRFRGCRSQRPAWLKPAILPFALAFVLICTSAPGASAHPGLSCLKELEGQTKQRKSGPEHDYLFSCWDNGMTCTAGVSQKTSGPPVAPVHDLRATLERCFEAKMSTRMANQQMPQDTIFMHRATREGCTLTPIELKELKGHSLPYAWAFLAVCHLAP